MWCGKTAKFSPFPGYTNTDYTVAQYELNKYMFVKHFAYFLLIL